MFQVCRFHLIVNMSINPFDEIALEEALRIKERGEAEEHAKHDYLEARRRALLLEGISMVFHVRAGEDGKLFGAVTNADVADRLNQGELDFEVDRRIVMLEEPLKMLGLAKVAVRLHSQVEVEIEVQV